MVQMRDASNKDGEYAKWPRRLERGHGIARMGHGRAEHSPTGFPTSHLLPGMTLMLGEGAGRSACFPGTLWVLPLSVDDFWVCSTRCARTTTLARAEALLPDCLLLLTGLELSDCESWGAVA